MLTRRLVLCAVALGVLAGPLTAASHAGWQCTLREKLGIHSPMPCED